MRTLEQPLLSLRPEPPPIAGPTAVLLSLAALLLLSGAVARAAGPRPLRVSISPPAPPALEAPADLASGVSTSPVLSVAVNHPDAASLTVTFYARPVEIPPGPDFTLIGLPDTQFYTASLYGGTPAMFRAQTQWTVANRAARNIAYVSQLGDCVENGDNGGNQAEWLAADSALALLEDPLTSGLPEGIPYGVCVGNHDQTPNGTAAGSTWLYNQYFGTSRFAGRSYYGGHYGINNDNYYDLFSAGGLDFIVVSLEFDAEPDAAVLAWADQLLTTFSNRRAIVISHELIGAGNPASFTPQGQAIYDALKGHANLFLMLCGHLAEEGRRQDTFNGHTVHTLLSDYQTRANGGNGWLRILELSPANNVIRVRTYSPILARWESDADSSSQFTLDCDLHHTDTLQVVGTRSGVAPGSIASITWPGLARDTQYEWYATVSDGASAVTGPTWRFTTLEGSPPAVQVISPDNFGMLTIGQPATLEWSASDNVGVTTANLLLSRAGIAGPFESIALGAGNSGSFGWTVTGPPPAPPTLDAPANLATGVSTSPVLSVGVEDPDADSLTVIFYARAVDTPAVPDFTLIGLPDTQYYTSGVNGGTPAMFTVQTQWIVANRVARNIAYVSQLGDCVQNGNNGGNPVEWQAADSAMALLEDPLTTGLPEGIPYGVCVGNHDQTPNGTAAGSTWLYNQYFGTSRFAGRSYYGGHYGINNDNYYDLFSAGGLDFIVVSLEFDAEPDAAVLAWADQLLTTFSNRRAIVISHELIGAGNPASFTPQGQAIYDALKGHANLFLMLCGHLAEEGRRQDTFNGHTVHTLLSDYQTRANGGNGWLRILELSPANNVIRVRTYSPILARWESDADSSSQFTLDCDLHHTDTLQVVGTRSGVAPGSIASITWPGLARDTQYEWYATVSDGASAVTGPTWRFTTLEGTPPAVQVIYPAHFAMLTIGQPATLEWSASDNVGVTAVDLLLSRAGPTGPFETIALGVPNSGTFGWTVTGPLAARALLRVVAHDAAGNSGEDMSDASFAILLSTTGVDDAPGAGLALSPVSPDPSHGHARIRFAVRGVTRARVGIVDVQGREVAVLANGVFGDGVHEAVWGGETTRGGVAPAGIYFARVQVGGRELTRRFALVR